jgi:uncharacterized protein (DUF4415 family)
MPSASAKRTKPRSDDISVQYPPLTNAEVAEIERGLANAGEHVRKLPDHDPEGDARLTAAAEGDPDNPPLGEDAVLKPLYQVMPEFVAKMMRRKRGRPPVETPKKQVTLRLDQDIIDHFKAEGPGWQTRINDALRGVARKAAGRR